MRLGILEQNDREWTAGRIYTNNLLAALTHLPEDEAVTPVLLIGPRVSISEGEFETHSFAHIDGCPDWKRLWAKLRSFLQRRSTRSLCSVARDANIDIIFPVTIGKSGGPRPACLGWVPDYQNLHFPQNWPDGRYRAWLEQTTHSSKDLVVSSEAARVDAERFFGRTDRVSVLPFSIVPADKWYQSDPQNTAKRYSLPSKFILFPSQFWTHKDHATLLEAVDRVHKRGVDIRLVLCGLPRDTRAPGHGAAILKRIAEMEGIVTSLGLIARPDVVQLLRASCGVVQPSRFEGWSALVEEARALGKPLVVSDIPVHREQDPPDARFFPVGDADKLALALEELWSKTEAGPDLEREQAARTRAAGAALSFARRFRAIAMAAIDAQRSE